MMFFFPSSSSSSSSPRRQTMAVKKISWFFPSASALLHLLLLVIGTGHRGNVLMQHSKHVVLFAAANDTLLNPNTCTNEESGVQTKAKILCRIAPGTNNDGIFKQQFNGDSGLLDCFDPEVMETLLSGFPCNQDIDVVIRYKLINPNGFDMRVVLGRNEAGDTVSTKENGKRTRLIFNDRDVTFSTTSETALSDGMIIPAKQSHIAVVITKIKSCQQSLYQAEMKMKLKPVDSSNGHLQICARL
mmetsp:Transcript_2827/g.5286  ORF Transcript_2827/g.5286 Transcript_2827/m.5286 type:complete len:244 (+) Transcript_2827:566-1297(+)